MNMFSWIFHKWKSLTYFMQQDPRIINNFKICIVLLQITLMKNLVVTFSVNTILCDRVYLSHVGS